MSHIRTLNRDPDETLASLNSHRHFPAQLVRTESNISRMEIGQHTGAMYTVHRGHTDPNRLSRWNSAAECTHSTLRNPSSLHGFISTSGVLKTRNRRLPHKLRHVQLPSGMGRGKTERLPARSKSFVDLFLFFIFSFLFCVHFSSRVGDIYSTGMLVMCGGPCTLPRYCLVTKAKIRPADHQLDI